MIDRTAFHRVGCVALVLVTAALWHAFGFCQEFDGDTPNEAVEETNARISESVRQLESINKRASHVAERIRLLKGLRQSLFEVQRTEKALEDTEANGANSVEEAEKKLEEVERKVARQEILLHIHGQRGDLLELLNEVQEAGLDTEVRQVEWLLKDRKRVATLIKEQGSTETDTPEEPIEKVSERREALDRDFEHSVEVIYLKLRIHWARKEGELEEVEELQRELERIEELDRELKQGNDGEVSSDALPIKLSDSDFASVSKLRFDQDIAPTLMSVCGDCHDSVSAGGDLNLEELIRTQPLVVNRKHWLNVIRQIQVRSMPPVDQGEMTDQERIKVAAWLTQTIEQFDYRSVHRVGHESARRLTREEYNNTIRDLIGIDLRPADRFPSDLTASSGFRNSANSLFFQTLTLERFVLAAESVVRAAYPVDRRNGPHDAWDRVLGGDNDINDPKEIITRFASRAFRRPATDAEVRGLIDRYEQQVAAGLGRRESLRDVIEIVLISPAFLFRSEEAKPAARISNFEMASRLSYFLWASMPDDELFAAARRGELLQRENLVRHVDRMLDDPRSLTIGTLFASQWFGTDNLNRVRPDPIDNPWATDGLIDAMTQETALLFHSLVKENRSIERLLDADYAFLNQELASHYGIRGVEGRRMRRVSLEGLSRRGLLGNASVLAVTSFPGRVSPVMRGNWILTELLGTPPPPPPPNVSEFDERIADSERLTQRQKLELHRRNPNCYSCHSQIDPLGFTLSDFDWFGRYRPVEGGRGESHGRLPDGTEIEGLDGLIESLLHDRLDDLSRQAITKLLSYALGRQLEYYDEATVRGLLDDFERDERRLRGLIHSIVQTDTFQMNETGIESRDE